MKKHWKRNICMILSAILCLSAVQPAVAATKKELQNKQKAAQSKLEKANSNIGSLEEDKQDVQNEVNELDNELVMLLGTIDILESEIAVKEEEIKQAQADYDVAKADEQTQYEAMKQRIKYMYEKGDTQYLELFLESKSIADAINKVDYAEKLYQYDRNLLLSYKEIKDQVAAMEESLILEKSEMEAMEGECKIQQNELEVMIEEKQSLVENFDAKLSAARAEARQYQAQIKEANLEIARIAEEEKRKREAAEKAAREKAAKEAAAKASSSSSKTEEKDTEHEDYADEPGEDEAPSEPEPKPETKPSPSGSSTGQAIASYACQFIGNPYVAGGTSLTNGADCSGFTMSVYAHFGYSIPRTSYSQLNTGRAVSYSEAQPGDIMCYAGHVGIYIGNGMIVHASTPATGIKTTPATYRQILSVRRII